MVSAQGSTPGVQPRTFSSKLVLWISGAERGIQRAVSPRAITRQICMKERESTASSQNRADASGCGKSTLPPLWNSSWTPKTENFTAPGTRRVDESRRRRRASVAPTTRSRTALFSILFGRAEIRTLQFRLRSTDTTGYVRILEIPAGGLISGIIVTGETGLKVHNPKRILRDARPIEDGSSFRASLKLIADTGTKIPFDYYRIMR